jgi:hypothetical protein
MSKGKDFPLNTVGWVERAKPNFAAIICWVSLALFPTYTLPFPAPVNPHHTGSIKISPVGRNDIAIILILYQSINIQHSSASSLL